MAGRKPRDSERFRKAFRELGRRIHAFRRVQGLTQDQLAEACGMSGTAISQYERADAFVSIDALFVIAKALDLTAADLLRDLDVMIGEPSDFEPKEEQPGEPKF